MTETIRAEVMAVAPPNEADFARLRHNMVRYQLESRDVADADVLEAMRRVPRHLFVPEGYRHAAYDDTPLVIGSGQTISQPYIVARMTELLELHPHDKVLEIGTGSGYQAAVLAELAGEVWTMERHPELARSAENILAQLGYSNIHIIVGDGTLGYAESAPYDGVIVTAAAPHVPAALAAQLAEGGRLVIPVGGANMQELRVLSKEAGRMRESRILDCRFVPLVGRDAYPEKSA